MSDKNMDRSVMSKKKPSKKEALKLLTQFSKQAFQNGIDFYNDALLLYEENESYGHAFGLLVLAEEEFAKSWFLIHIHEMVKNDIMFFSEQEDAPKLSEVISNHKAKHLFLECLGKASMVLMSKTDFPPFEEVTDNDALRVMEEILNEIEKPTNDEIKRVINKIQRDYRSMQRNREEGFYVDLDKDRKITGPHRITKNECEKQFLKTRFSHWVCSIWSEVKVTKKHVPLLKKMKKLDIDKE